MDNQKHILVITDEEDCPVVGVLLRLQIVPVILSSIMSTMNMLRHISIMAIIIDKEHQNVDAIELILNARDVAAKIPIFVPENYQQNEDWSIIQKLGKIIPYNDKQYSLNKEITKFIKKNPKH